jgi:hypothetical protein
VDWATLIAILGNGPAILGSMGKGLTSSTYLQHLLVHSQSSSTPSPACSSSSCSSEQCSATAVEREISPRVSEAWRARDSSRYLSFYSTEVAGRGLHVLRAVCLFSDRLYEKAKPQIKHGHSRSPRWTASSCLFIMYPFTKVLKHLGHVDSPLLVGLEVETSVANCSGWLLKVEVETCLVHT